MCLAETTRADLFRRQRLKTRPSLGWSPSRAMLRCLRILLCKGLLLSRSGSNLVDVLKAVNSLGPALRIAHLHHDVTLKLCMPFCKAAGHAH